MEHIKNEFTFNTLRRANIARLAVYKNKRGELISQDWMPAQWLQALVGEVGEYANLRKKFERGDIPEDEFKTEAAKELADIQIYLDLLALQLGVDLGFATIAKFNEVSRRIGSTVSIHIKAGEFCLEGIE